MLNLEITNPTFFIATKGTNGWPWSSFGRGLLLSPPNRHFLEWQVSGASPTVRFATRLLGLKAFLDGKNESLDTKIDSYQIEVNPHE